MASSRVRLSTAFVAVTVPAVVAAGTVVASGTASADPSAGCAPLYVVGVPGTGETSERGSTQLNSGMLGTITRPLASLAGSLSTAVAVPYDAGFGGAVRGGKLPYAQSLAQGESRLTAALAQVAQRCPDSQVGLLGFSQGAQVVSMVAKKIGAGTGPIDASRVAAVGLLGNPVRQPGAPVFAGGATRPTGVGGDSGSLNNIPAWTSTPPQGGGIGPTADQAGDYGSLEGRVGDFCNPGDLACDAPANSPLLHVVTNIAGSSKLDGRDPIGSLVSVATALGSTAIKAATTIVNDDVSGDTLDSVSYAPQKSISQRLADASDPRTPPPSPSDVVGALFKIGTIGFNAISTVVQSIFTPDTIATMAAAGLANPAAALGVLAAKIPGAIAELIPPTTVSQWADEAFQAVKTEVTSNADLVNLTAMTSYWSAGVKHDAYAKASAPSSPSPALYIAQWLAAVAHDAAGQHDFAPYRADGVLNFDAAASRSGFTPSVAESPAPVSPSTSSSPPVDSDVPQSDPSITVPQ